MQSVQAYLLVFDLRIIVRINAKCGVTMSKETASNFFAECESGGGWNACQKYCTSDATFSCQALALEGVDTLSDYCDWLRGIYTPLPNAGYEIKSVTVNEDSSQVVFFAVFTGTHTGEGGPVPATGKSVRTDYVYIIEFSGSKISHMTKVWNSESANIQIGWQ